MQEIGLGFSLFHYDFLLSKVYGKDTRDSSSQVYYTPRKEIINCRQMNFSHLVNQKKHRHSTFSETSRVNFRLVHAKHAFSENSCARNERRRVVDFVSLMPSVRLLSRVNKQNPPNSSLDLPLFFCYEPMTAMSSERKWERMKMAERRGGGWARKIY